MNPPILKEWINIINQLPNDKAPGTSGITNEMLKHIGPATQHYLWLLVKACLKLNDIPQQWRLAYIYPIPKPKEWKYNLVNTRPITLLETTRKAIVKLINKRLMDIFTTHNVLQGLNFAGLPHKSTFEPLRLLDNILQDAKDNDKELYIYSQDMSKAYDRVNIYMLEASMHHLKLPHSFITFIRNLFTNRYNRIFTAHGITDKYHVLVGIDQGEVISPLLWCIYYDPLLSRLQNMSNYNLTGYQLSHTWQPNLKTTENQTKSCNIPLTAFMDDSNWIADSIAKLENTLHITSSFNTLNDIQTNDDKAVLLTTKVPDNHEPIILNVNSKQIAIKPISLHDSTRILGVWLSAGKSNKYIFDQLKQEIQQYCTILQHKIVTDQQLLYIYNMVIIPRIEFRSQLVFLSKEQCNTLQAPFRILFKHKLKMAKNIPNAILTNSFIYNFRDLYQVQMQSKFTNFLVQINDNSIVGLSTNIRLLKLQSKWWLPNNPLICWPFQQQANNKDHIIDLLSTIHEFHLSFNIADHFKNQIQGGNIPLCHILDTKSYKNALKSLKYNGIMYLDQLTSLDGFYLLKWIDTRLYEHNTSIKIPKWFKILESIVITSPNTTRRLKTEYCTTLKTPGDYSPLSLIKQARPHEWIIVWNNITNDAIYGQVNKTQNDDEIIFTHWTNDFLIDNTSPSYQPLRLKKCSGCLLNDSSITFINKYSSLPRPSCIITCKHQDALHIPLTTKQKILDHVQFSISTFGLKQIAKYHFFNIHPITIMHDITYPESIILPYINHSLLKDSFFSPLPLIEKYIINSSYKRELTKLAKNFINRTNFRFYTDGSVKHENGYTTAAAAWIEVLTVIPTEFTTGVNNDFISSTKAELIGIITALMTVPQHSIVDIYTDSKNVIDMYQHLIQENTLSYARECLKTMNIELWFILYNIVFTQQLQLLFHKVKAHSNNSYNDKVDELAKLHLLSETIQFKVSNGLYITAPKIIDINISTHLGHFITSISHILGFQEFFNLNRNAKYKSLGIDWLLTFKCLSSGSSHTITSFTSSNRKAKRIKLMLEELPTLEYLQHCKPSIYDTSWTCCLCNNPETFAHLWTCSERLHIMQSIVNASRKWIIDFLSIAIPQLHQNNPYVLAILNDSNIWNIASSDTQFTFIDLIKGFIPLSLSYNIHQLVSNRELTNIIIDKFTNSIFDAIQDQIWLPRCALIIQKEKSLGITQKQKNCTKNHGTFFLKRSSHVPSYVSDLPIYNDNLTNAATLIHISVTNGQHFSHFLDGS